MSKAGKVKALNALLDSSTLSEAADKAGISRKTLYSYIRNDADFARAFQTAQERLTFECIDRIEADRQRATEAVFAIMDDVKQPGAVRLKAAQTILDHAEAFRQRMAMTIQTMPRCDMPTIIIERPRQKESEST